MYSAKAGLHDTQLLQVGLDNLGGNRHIAILRHYGLTGLGEHHLHKLLLHRGERLVRSLVHVNVQEARQWVLAGQGVLCGRFNEGLAILGERYGAHA